MTLPLAPTRFKFLLGEWHLASWRPLLQPLRCATGDVDPQWPGPRHVTAAALASEADGYWCQQAAVDRFPLGLSRLGPWLCYVPRRERLHCVDIVGDFNAYQARWSAKTRYNLRRAVKKLQDYNPPNLLLQIADRPEQIEAFLHTAAAISRTTYQSRLLQSGLDYDPQSAQAMARQASRGEGRGYLLHDRGRAIAFAWCSGAGERLTYDVIGYLEDTAALSPGTVLLYLIVEDLFRLGRFKVFDFGVGDAPYKQLFATRTLEFADAYLLRLLLRHRVRLWLHWQLDGLSTAVGRLLDRFGLKTRVKRWLRSVRGGS